jgi:hypothetical protein
MTHTRLCATCGDPLAYSGRGRPPVVHSGSCARVRANEVDEDRRETRYRHTLRDAAVRAPFIGPEHVEGDDEGSTMDRLASAGFAPLYDDPREDVPKHRRARSAHRREVLASLSSVDDANETGPAIDAPVRCLDCPILAHLDGVRGIFTTASLSNLTAITEDRRVRRHIAQDGPAALMVRRPA